MTHLIAATVQFQHRARDKEYNLGRITHFAHQAKEAGVQLVVFPELCISGCWHLPRATSEELAAQAEPVDGDSIRQLAALAVELQIGIGAGWLELGEDGRCYNSYRVCLPDGTGHTHRKLHAFEHREIAVGNRYTLFDTPWGVRAAILICWDNNLIENVRACALQGAELLIAPHQTGGTNSVSPHGMKLIPMELWENRQDDPEALRQAFQGPNGREWLMRWLPSRAHDNGLFILFSNAVGADEDEVRTGNAMILDPYGRIVAESDAIGDDMVIAALDLDLGPSSSGRRWMRGRRPDLYGILTERRGDESSALDTRFDGSLPGYFTRL